MDKTIKTALQSFKNFEISRREKIIKNDTIKTYIGIALFNIFLLVWIMFLFLFLSLSVDLYSFYWELFHSNAENVIVPRILFFGSFALSLLGFILKTWNKSKIKKLNAEIEEIKKIFNKIKDDKQDK